MARIVVVGAGIAGLSAAAWLADLGHNVIVVEANRVAGGQVSVATADGHDVDFGPVAFTLPAVFRDLFRKTGRPLEREVDLAPVDPAVRYLFSDRSHVDIPHAGRAGAAAAIGLAFGAQAAQQWNAVIGHGERMWQALRPHILTDTGRRPPRHTSADLHEFADHRLADTRLRSLLGTYAVTVGSNPTRPTQALAVLPYLEQTFGLWRVDGGTIRLVHALAARATDRGAAFRFGVPVSDIITTGSRVSGVLLMDGELIQADVVVCTIQPGRLGTLMGRQQETVTSRLLGHSQTDRHNYGRSILSLLLVTAAPVITKDEDQMPLRTIIVPSQAGGETSEQRSHRASHHAFAQSTITVHRSHRPAHADTHSWVLHADCPPHSVAGAGIDWTEPGQATMQANCLLDVVRSVGLDLGEHVAIRQIRTPYDLEHELGAPGGIVHGSSSRLAHNPLGKTITTVVPRPANQTRVKGLFLAGAGAHPGPTVPLAGASAAIVADLVGRA